MNKKESMFDAKVILSAAAIVAPFIYFDRMDILICALAAFIWIGIPVICTVGVSKSKARQRAMRIR